jgi:NADH:ubiquinone oxidoreductase subunit 3 (subunit A)
MNWTVLMIMIVTAVLAIVFLFIGFALGANAANNQAE